MLRIFSLFLAVLVVSGCSIRADLVSNMPDAEGVKIEAVGLGVLPDEEDMSLERRHLLAVKASEMDARRSLVNKIYGVQISSKVTVRSLSTENDSFKAQVEGLIQMAEVIETKPIMDGEAYETTMMVELTPEFRSYVLNNVESNN